MLRIPPARPNNSPLPNKLPVVPPSDTGPNTMVASGSSLERVGRFGKEWEGAGERVKPGQGRKAVQPYKSMNTYQHSSSIPARPNGQLLFGTLNLIAVGCWLLAAGMSSLSCARAAESPPCPSFGAPAGFPVGSNPISVAVGDFNGDGHPDVAAANAQRTPGALGDVSVLLGNGDGTFQPAANYAAGNEPYCVVTADLNGDGKLDLAVPNSWGDDVSVFLGHGDGTFGPAAAFPTAAHPLCLAVADFDGDHHADLAVITQWAGQVSVLLGNGDGTFRPPVNYPAGDWPHFVVVGDFNLDGRMDVVTANTANDSVSVLLGNGDGTFGPAVQYPVGDQPIGLAVGDLNGDARPDLVCANIFVPSVSLLFGQGDGTLAAAVEYPLGPGGAVQEVALADFNLDGLLDVAVGNTWGNSIMILMGKGGGLFEAQATFGAGQQPVGVAAADINGDGMCDLVAAASASDAVSVLLNECPPTFVVAAGSARGCPGTQVLIPVTTQGARTLGTLQFSMHWDPVVATFVGVEQIGLAGMTYAENFGGDTAAGTLVVSWEDPSLTGTLVADGTTLFAVRFTVDGAPGATSAVTLDGNPVAIEFTAPDLHALNVTLQSGQVGVPDTFSIAGQVLYYAGARAVAGVDLDLTGDATRTTPSDVVGAYVHTVTACGDYVVTPGKALDSPVAAGVTMLDASLIRRHVLRIQSLDTPYKLLAADVNDSEGVSTVDIRLIKQLVLGLRTSFPAGLWRFVRSDYAFPDPAAPWNPAAARSYAGLDADLTGQDYTAVKLGDVNGSWTAGGGGALMGPGSRAGVGLQTAANSPRLGVGSLTTAPNSVVRVPVTARDLTRMTSSQFTLQWDPAVLKYVDVCGFGLPGGGMDDFGTGRTGQGLLAFAWDDASGRGVNVKQANLFWVTFAVVGSAGSRTTVAIVGAPTPQEIACKFVATAVVTERGVVSVVREHPAPGKPSEAESLR